MVDMWWWWWWCDEFEGAGGMRNGFDRASGDVEMDETLYQ